MGAPKSGAALVGHARRPRIVKCQIRINALEKKGKKIGLAAGIRPRRPPTITRNNQLAPLGVPPTLVFGCKTLYWRPNYALATAA